jgi:hypothetical protein
MKYNPTCCAKKEDMLTVVLLINEYILLTGAKSQAYYFCSYQKAHASKSLFIAIVGVNDRSKSNKINGNDDFYRDHLANQQV